MLPAVPADTYVVLICKRVRLAGVLRVPGTFVAVPPDRLRVAVHLCKTGAARPANKLTQVDVEVFLALQRAIARRADSAR